MEEKNLTDQLLENFKAQGAQKTSEYWEKMKKSTSFRPTIYIGVGGFGCGVVRELKRAIQELIPDEQIRKGFGFIGIDTHPADKSDILSLNEYIGITGVTPHEVASQPENKGYLDWYNKLPKGNWKADSITGGANQVRAVGRLAFLYPPTLNRFINVLIHVYNRTNEFRDSFNLNSTPKVYLISSLAGGTGAGMLLDVSIISRKFLKDRIKSKVDLQGIFSTADPLERVAPSVQLPDLFTNTYSALKEIYGLSESELKVSYKVPDFESFQAGMISLPNPIFLITGENIAGKIVLNDFEDLRSSVVSYLLFEIHTPINNDGAKIQDKENNNTDEIGNSMMKKIFSSLGVIRFGVPSKEIINYASQVIMIHALNRELSTSISVEDIFAFINDQKLGEAGSDQLQQEIRKGRDNKNINVSIDILSEIQDIKHYDLAKVCKGIIDAKLNRLKVDYYGILEDNYKSKLEKVKQKINDKLDKIAYNDSVSSCLEFIEQLTKNIISHQESIVHELTSGKDKLAKAKDKTIQSVGGISLAAQSGFIGRTKRVNLATNTFEVDLQTELNQQIIVWSLEMGSMVYEDLIAYLNEIHKTWKNFKEKTEARKSYLIKETNKLMTKIERMADINRRGKGNRFSIINVDQVVELYKEGIDSKIEESISTQIRQEWKNNGSLKDIVTSEEIWYSNTSRNLIIEVGKRFTDLNILTVINRFYSDENKKHGLFENIMALGSPLFPLNTNFEETNGYTKAQIIAVNPDIKDDILNILSPYITAGVGKSVATYPTKDEVIIYSIQHGFTPHSLTRMSIYYSHYTNSIKKYKDNRTKNSRPYNSRVETESWPELIPISNEDESIRKWFAVGRALSYLFPSKTIENGKPDPDKNEAFIYNRGSYYYINMTIEHRLKKIKLGNGLETSIEAFGENRDYQDYIQTNIEKFISEKGIGAIRNRIVAEYIPILDTEIEKARSSNDPERALEIEELAVAIKKYVDKELQSHSV